jgi:hypothetical protein
MAHSSHNPNPNRCLKCGKKRALAFENSFSGPEIDLTDGEIFDAFWSPLESTKGGWIMTKATPSASASASSSSSQPTPDKTMILNAVTNTVREADTQISQPKKEKVLRPQLARPRITIDRRRRSVTRLLQNLGRRIISPFGTSVSPWSLELPEWQMLR